MAETKRQRAAKRLEALRDERRSWDPLYRDLAEQFLPRRSRWLLDAGEANRGANRHLKVIDGTPIFAARTLASGMLAGNSSPSRPWVRFVTEDEDLMEVGRVREWLEIVAKKMAAVFARSNFYSALPAVYGESGVFGTAAMLILEHPKDVILCRPYTAGSYFLANGPDGSVDTFYCQYKMTVRQMAREYGVGALSAAARSLFNSGSLEQWLDVVHLIEPNEEREPGKVDSRNMTFRSAYYEVASTEDKFLRESGFEEFPVMAPRWSVTGEDVYGSSPAMDARGDAKQLQFQQRAKSRQIDKLTDPPMVADIELRTKKASLLPGEITYAGFTQSGSAPRFQPAYTPNPAALVAIREDNIELQSRIHQAMYVDLFLMLTMSDRRQITAEEVARRFEEKVLMLDPVLTQAQKELLSPAIDRTYYIMQRRGMLPPPPEELEGQNFKPEYISILAQAQRMVATAGIDRIVGFAGMVAEAQAKAGLPPTALDKIDLDQAIDEYGNAIGAPARVVRSDDAVAAIREQRAQAEQAQQLAAAAQPAKDAAAAAKSLSETQVAGASALDRMVGAA